MAARIAKVVVESGPDREFSYRIPDSLRDRVFLGSKVSVSFGHSTRVAYVTGFDPECGRSDLKDLSGVEGSGALIPERMLRLARWVADYYCASFESAVRAVLPAAVRRESARFLEQTFVSPALSADPGRLSPRQQDVLSYLAEHPEGVWLQDLRAHLGITDAPVRTLARRGLLGLSARVQPRRPMGLRNVLPTQPLPLMPEQLAALDRICRAVNAPSLPGSPRMATDSAPTPTAGRESRETPGVVLLYGVTGSGKTEVYLQAIAHVLNQGKGAIVLVPEIALTPQTVERFVSRFGDQIAVLHSHLSDGERHDEWHRIRGGKARVVVGARSAVFAPVTDLGLIVVDEEHEPSYKQDEVPRYHARDVAVVRGRLESCAVVLGSATPALESWNNTRTGKYALAELPRRVDHCTMPTVRVVDMRVEAERTGRVGVFSKDLLDAIALRLERAEQTILFLNRRGYSTSLVCPKCGYVAKCNLCSVACTYHKTDNRLRCHICGGSEAVPGQCPECRDPAFRFAGIGTQRVEEIIRKCFPHAAIQRIDADVTTRKDAYEDILGRFRTGKIDILLGTQMIAKGLHFPNVTLVGVVYADLSLHVPDFRAGERTFQLLAQVAGRAGRGERAGEVLIQTYTPFAPAIQAARRMDFTGFSDQELEFRRELSYPPFSHLTCITLKGKSEERVAFFAKGLWEKLKEGLADRVNLSDPCPAPLSRAKGDYRYQLILRSPSTRVTTAHLRAVLQAFRFPGDVTCTVNIDALNLM
jgi:primosomal protein N' (replication factor Y)